MNELPVTVTVKTLVPRNTPPQAGDAVRRHLVNLARAASLGAVIETCRYEFGSPSDASLPHTMAVELKLSPLPTPTKPGQFRIKRAECKPSADQDGKATVVTTGEVEYVSDAADGQDDHKQVAAFVGQMFPVGPLDERRRGPMVQEDVFHKIIILPTTLVFLLLYSLL